MGSPFSRAQRKSRDPSSHQTANADAGRKGGPRRHSGRLRSERGMKYAMKPRPSRSASSALLRRRRFEFVDQSINSSGGAAQGALRCAGGAAPDPGRARHRQARELLEARRCTSRSRATWPEETALSVQTVSIIAEELTASGLLLEKGFRQGSRGAPAVDLTINPEGGFTFGISLDHRRLVCVLVDLAGHLQRQTVTQIAGLSPDAVIKRIERAVRILTKDQKADPARIWGAGVVMPMLFENERPISFGPTSMPAWQNYPIVESLRDRLGLPVLVENDATAAAVGEHLYGVGRRLSDFFYVYIGAGIGGHDPRRTPLSRKCRAGGRTRAPRCGTRRARVCLRQSRMP